MLYNCFVPEFNTIEELMDKLLDAAKLLNKINSDLKGQKVFINCESGMTRGPTLVILYLCLFCKVDFW